MPQGAARKRYGLLVLSILLLLLGGVGVYLGSHNYPIRTLGLMGVMAGAYIFRISHVNDRSGSLEVSGRRPDLEKPNGPGRLLWIISLALVPLLGTALFLLHVDEVNGGHEAWPADLFAAIGLAAAIVWGYLVAKIIGARTGNDSQN
jgi:hypothetical protein